MLLKDHPAFIRIREQAETEIADDVQKCIKAFGLSTVIQIGNVERAARNRVEKKYGLRSKYIAH